MVTRRCARGYAWLHCNASRLDFVQVAGKREYAIAKEETLSAEILVGRSRPLFCCVKINRQTACNFLIALVVSFYAAEDVFVALGLLVAFSAARNAAQELLVMISDAQSFCFAYPSTFIVAQSLVRALVCCQYAWGGGKDSVL